MREELEKLIAEATPGPWEVDTIYNEDGCYSGGGGCGQGFNDYAIYAPIDGKAVQILDTSYSDDKLIEEDFGEDGKIAWDCIGKANAALIVFLVNNAPTILEALTERASMAAEIERLKAAIKIQASAVRTLQANEDTEINILRKQKREWHQAVSSLDSEREVNEILTAEIERLRGIVRGWHYLAVGPDEMGDYYTHKQLIKLSEPYASPALKALKEKNDDA
jgi:hypothetical protein